MNVRELNPEMTQEARACVVALRNGSLASFPTPSGWCTVCDCSNKMAVEALMGCSQLTNFCILIDHEGRLSKYTAPLSEPVLNLLEFSERPLQFVIEGASAAAPNIPLETPFMIATDPFSNRVASSFGKALLAGFGTEPVTNIQDLNTTCHVVNLRAGMHASPDQIVIMQFSKDGSFRFIKK